MFDKNTDLTLYNLFSKDVDESLQSFEERTERRKDNNLTNFLMNTHEYNDNMFSVEVTSESLLTRSKPLPLEVRLVTSERTELRSKYDEFSQLNGDSDILFYSMMKNKDRCDYCNAHIFLSKLNFRNACGRCSFIHSNKYKSMEL